MLSKMLVGLGMAAVLGLMGAGIAYAVTGTESDGWSGEGNGGRWSTSEAAGTGGRWSGAGAPIDGLQAAPGELATLSGVVESLEDSELVLRTDTSELVEVALGQAAYWEAQGVSLPTGEAVVIQGCYEDDDTLAANSVTLVASGRTIVLRDASGRPMWAGGRRNAGAEPAPTL